MNWLVLSLLSALFAALVTIFAKLGLKTIDSNVVAIVRSLFVTLTLLGFGLATGKLSEISWSLFSAKEGIFIILSGVAGAVSWLFYFWALKNGQANQVAGIDKLSLVFVVVLSAIFLAEKFTWKTILGAVLMSLGALIMVL